jgi:FkbM family methyltransferase
MKFHLRKRLNNSWSAFHSGELIYRLQIKRVGNFDVAFRSGTADESVLDHSFDKDIFFAGVPEYHVGATDVIIDVGAHIGTFSMLAARKAPQGRIYAIEASLETFNYLRTNIALNRLDHVRPFYLALSDRKGTVRLHHDRGNWGHSIMKEMSSRGEEVPSDTLENFLGENRIEDCAFIKFNCEGAEFPILMNTSNEILRTIRMMLVLYHEDLAEGYSLAALRAKLEEAGFTTELRNPRRTRGWLIAQRKD